jgi:hypothetical protein
VCENNKAIQLNDSFESKRLRVAWKIMSKLKIKSTVGKVSDGQVRSSRRLVQMVALYSLVDAHQL